MFEKCNIVAKIQTRSHESEGKKIGAEMKNIWRNFKIKIGFYHLGRDVMPTVEPNVWVERMNCEWNRLKFIDRNEFWIIHLKRCPKNFAKQYSIIRILAKVLVSIRSRSLFLGIEL